MTSRNTSGGVGLAVAHGLGIFVVGAAVAFLFSWILGWPLSLGLSIAVGMGLGNGLLHYFSRQRLERSTRRRVR